MTDRLPGGQRRTLRQALAAEQGSALAMAVCALVILGAFAMSALCLIEYRVRQLQVRSLADVAVLVAVSDGCEHGRAVVERNQATMTTCVRDAATDETMMTVVSRHGIGVLGGVAVSASSRAGYAE